jgi:phosphoserine aminotransferase
MRVFNFSAGPAALPIEVLQQARDEILDWRGSGLSVMEMSHRSDAFECIHEAALTDLRTLLNVPKHYRILFMQGGARAENALIPMNLLGARTVADYAITGFWSRQSHHEASRYCHAHIAVSSEETGFTEIPPFHEWQQSDDPAYLHVCTNETLHGVEFLLPTGLTSDDIPVVADMSSHLLSRSFDITPYGVIYGCAQKNMGIAGLTIVIVREDLLERALSICPTVFKWQTVAQSNSMINTPPTYAIYIAGLIFKWLKAQGGLDAVEARNIEKARLLYDTIDASGFYHNPVAKVVRSRMNIPFTLADPACNDDFLAGAREQGLLHLKGHAAVGGMRASLYNAVPLAAVSALINYMTAFERGRA